MIQYPPFKQYTRWWRGNSVILSLALTDRITCPSSPAASSSRAAVHTRRGRRQRHVSASSCRDLIRRATWLATRATMTRQQNPSELSLELHGALNHTGGCGDGRPVLGLGLRRDERRRQFYSASYKSGWQLATTTWQRRAPRPLLPLPVAGFGSPSREG